LIQPVVVRPGRDGYELICGHRRVAACRRLGWSRIPALVVQVGDKSAFEMALTENLQRKSLDSLEEAEAFQRYIVGYGWGGVSELARRIGKSEEYVSHRVLLLDLPESVRDKVSRRILNVSQATEMIWIKDPSIQEVVAEMVADRRLSVRDTKEVVRLVRSGVSANEAFEHASKGTFIALDYKKRILQELKRSILSCRSSLFVIDSVIGRVELCGGEGKTIAERMLERRRSLHGLIDELVNDKVRLEKDIRRLD
jgi:ParB family chromosome partitioning protein